MQVDRIQAEVIHSRSPSPWDKFSASPSPRAEGLEIEMRRSDGIPRLSPEVEQGNVEYKLILRNPSAERLQKLVTQLNWRLMEGNGEAYYQLGVADSGELVGLTKEEMESTLETLENMAGELGASVLIRREIEVRARLSGLALDSVNGMGDEKDASANLTSTEFSTTDTDTSDADATDETEGDTTDSTTAVDASRISEDPNEIIVRSAPVPITYSFLRREKEKHRNHQQWQRDDTLRPQDLLPSPASSYAFASSTQVDNDVDDGDPQFELFDLGDIQNNFSSLSASQLDPSLPPKSKMPRRPKPSRQPKGARAPFTPAPPKTPEQIAQKMADKRAKRDRRRESRKRALMDPVYPHVELATQDGVEGKIDYEKIVTEDLDEGSSFEGGSLTNEGMLDSLVTLKQEDIGTARTIPSVALSTAKGFPDPETGGGVISPGVTSDAHGEPRLIVEALVVRKAGFGRGFVDLSQFDEELRHLPSFSLS